MSIINGVGRVGIRNYVSPTTSSSYLLDTYGGATVGYSLRKLSSTYAGFAIRVRRSSDNTEQNIGFDGSGNLDTTSLLAFVGSGNGFVTTWYDQSGDTSNNNPSSPGYTNKTMVQTTAASQPIIVTSGVIELKSGKPTIKLTPNTFLNLPVESSSSILQFHGTDHSFFAVYEKDAMANVINFITNSNHYLWLDWGGGTIQYNGNNSMYGTIPANVTKLISLSNVWNNSQKFYSNNSLIGTRTYNYTEAGCNMQYIGWSSHSYTTYFSEIIMYRNAQTSNMSSINNSINSYYSIYPTYTSRTTAFAAATGITDTTILNALNTFDTGLISNGLDTKMKALYPFVGGNATTHKYNFMDARDTDSAFRLQFNGGWVHSSTGVLPNGTNAYADTYYNLQYLNQNNTHLSIYNTNNSYVKNIDMGAFNETSVNGAFIATEVVTGISRARIFKNALDYPLTDNRGYFLANSNSTNSQYYINNVNRSTIANSGTFPLDSRNIYIGALNGNFSYYFANGKYTFSSIGNGLTDAEASTLYTLTQALQTSLSRQV